MVIIGIGIDQKRIEKLISRIVITSALPSISLAAYYKLFLVITHHQPTHVPPSALISCNCHFSIFITMSWNLLIKDYHDAFYFNMSAVHCLGITLVVAKAPMSSASCLSSTSLSLSFHIWPTLSTSDHFIFPALLQIISCTRPPHCAPGQAHHWWHQAHYFELELDTSAQSSPW